MESNGLSIAEEMVLLMLDEESGSFIRVRDYTLRYALSGALLMDLAIRNRIDTDLESLVVADSTPTGDSLLDGLLRHIHGESGTRSIRFWIERTAVHSESIREVCLERLVTRGILEEQERQYFWVVKSRRYPAVDGTVEKEVKRRLFDILFSDSIPDPKDVTLITLTQACGVLSTLLSRRELDKASDRIEQIRKLDLIGQMATSAITDIEVSLVIASQPQFY